MKYRSAGVALLAAFAISVVTAVPAEASPVADRVPAAGIAVVSLKTAKEISLSLSVNSYTGSDYNKVVRYPGPCRVVVRDVRTARTLLSKRFGIKSVNVLGSFSVDFKLKKRASLRKGRYAVTAKVSCAARTVKVKNDGPAYRVKFTAVTGKSDRLERLSSLSFAYLD